MHELDCGVKVNERNINNLRYADDTVLIASSAAGLQRMVESMDECSHRAGLKMNVKETKYMVVSGKANFNSLILDFGLILMYQAKI